MKRNILIASILTGSVFLDQITKVIVRSHIALFDRIEVFGSVVILTHVENLGAFLGLGSDWPAGIRAAVFGILSGCVVIAALVYLFRERRMRVNGTVALSCIAGGGMGNMIDRIIFGGRVTDFANIGIGRIRTGVFNVADVFLMLGLFLFIVENIRDVRSDARREPPNSSSDTVLSDTVPSDTGPSDTGPLDAPEQQDKHA